MLLALVGAREAPVRGWGSLGWGLAEGPVPVVCAPSTPLGMVSVITNWGGRK